MSTDLCELEQAVVRQKAEADAHFKMTKARIRLIMPRDKATVFFASLALRLELVCEWRIDTAATNGRQLFYNPDFVMKISLEELVAVVVHEVMHCAFKHFCRRDGRGMRAWNIATDLAINSIIKEAGMKLPEGGCFPGQGAFSDMPEGLSAEDYYNRLPIIKIGELGDGSDGDPFGCGGILDAGGMPNQEQDSHSDGMSPAEAKQLEADWDVATRQARSTAETSGQGNMPGGLRSAVDGLLEPVVDWKSVLREFVSAFAKNDYSWGHPNRRFVHQGIYLPSLRSEELGKVVIVMDTSGSIGDSELQRFASEAQGILECYQCEATFMLHHVDMYRTWDWTPQDGPVQVTGVVSGGTCHKDVFEKIDALPDPPVCVVCLTDMYSTFPVEPAYPVLWASTSKGVPAPWGRLVGVSL